MSLVIAIKDKNRIVLGADKQTSIGNNKDHLATKIWEVSDLPGALMGSVGSVRVSQILQYSELIDKNSFEHYFDLKYYSVILNQVKTVRRRFQRLDFYHTDLNHQLLSLV